VTDIETAEQELTRAGPFDVLVNNAGTNRPKPMREVTVDDYDAQMDLNVRAAYFVARTVASGMADAGIRGSIINISSQLGHVGGVGRTVYCASKFAVEGMTKAMALEFGPAGIRINTIAPTFIVTDLTRPFLAAPGFEAAVLAKIKLGSPGRDRGPHGTSGFPGLRCVPARDRRVAACRRRVDSRIEPCRARNAEQPFNCSRRLAAIDYIPSTMKEAESDDLMRPAAISFAAAESLHALAFSTLSKAIMTKAWGGVPSRPMTFGARTTYLPPASVRVAAEAFSITAL
jgi:hypothetical protein